MYRPCVVYRSCVLTGCGDVSRHAGSRSGAGAGHTLVSPERTVREGGDKERVWLRRHAQLRLVAIGEELAAVQTPADSGLSGSATASQRHAAPQFLHHGQWLLREHRDVVV